MPTLEYSPNCWTAGIGLTTSAIKPATVVIAVTVTGTDTVFKVATTTTPVVYFEDLKMNLNKK